MRRAADPMTAGSTEPVALVHQLLVAQWPEGTHPRRFLQDHRARRDTDAGDAVASLLVPAPDVAGLLAAVAPDDDVPVTVAALGRHAGLAPLVAARESLQDQPWLRPVGMWLDLPAHQVVNAAELTLEALEFQVPTTVFLPPDVDGDARDQVLDLLAADGAEHAGWHVEAATPGAAAAFLVGCARRRLPFELTTADLGLATVLAAATAAYEGADVDAVAQAWGAADPGDLDPLRVTRSRHLLRGVGVDDVARSLAELGGPGRAPA